jgi:hypothetical protein
MLDTGCWIKEQILEKRRMLVVMESLRTLGFRLSIPYPASLLKYSLNAND